MKIFCNMEFDLEKAYFKAQSIAFCKTKDPYGALSNMCAGFPIQIRDVKFRTAEHLYQALKFSDAEIQNKIIEQASPINAKRVSREYQHKVRPNWASIKVDVMRYCLQQKLSQNPQFAEVLKSTAGKHIVEYSKTDTFWGANDKELPSCWNGGNVLGKLLMELRGSLSIADLEIYGQKII